MTPNRVGVAAPPSPASTLTPATPEHGTNAGAARHSAAHETLCDECKIARAIYMREYRARLALGMPLAANAKWGSDSEPAWKRRRPDLADLAAVGPLLDEAWRWSA